MKNGAENDRLLNDEYDEWQKRQYDRENKEFSFFEFVCFVFVMLWVFYRMFI